MGFEIKCAGTVICLTEADDNAKAANKSQNNNGNVLFKGV